MKVILAFLFSFILCLAITFNGKNFLHDVIKLICFNL